MATKIGEEYSTKSLELMEMMNEYSVGVFGAVPGFVVSGKGSTLVVGRIAQSPLMARGYCKKIQYLCILKKHF